MNYRLFQYALPAPPELSDLNTYLAGNRVASVNHHLTTVHGEPMLVFLVQTVGAPNAGGGRSEPKVDYRALLDPEQFALYSRLRSERKKIAEEEGVPVYTIFSNAQLAEMVQKSTRTTADMARIDGVGKARVEKYGARILVHLTGGGSESR